MNFSRKIILRLSLSRMTVDSNWFRFFPIAHSLAIYWKYFLCTTCTHHHIAIWLSQEKKYNKKMCENAKRRIVLAGNAYIWVTFFFTIARTTTPNIYATFRMSTFSFALQFMRSYRVRLTLISTFLVNSSLLFMVVVGCIDSCDFYFISTLSCQCW